jgi:hypothetical protein
MEYEEWRRGRELLRLQRASPLRTIGIPNLKAPCDPSESICAQFSDTNLHHVRELMDEVLGAENFVAIINFKTMMPSNPGTSSPQWTICAGTQGTRNG